MTTTLATPIRTIVEIHPNGSDHPQARGLLLVEHDNKASIRVTHSYHPAYAVNRVVTVTRAELNVSPTKMIRAYFTRRGLVDVQDVEVDLNRLYDEYRNDTEMYLREKLHLAGKDVVAGYSDA